jgi:hypothetical protein
MTIRSINTPGEMKVFLDSLLSTKERVAMQKKIGRRVVDSLTNVEVSSKETSVALSLLAIVVIGFVFLFTFAKLIAP